VYIVWERKLVVFTFGFEAAGVVPFCQQSKRSRWESACDKTDNQINCDLIKVGLNDVPLC
jgi:hypothetical protein